MSRRPLPLLVFGAVLAGPAALGAPAETAGPKLFYPAALVVGDVVKGRK